MGTRAIYEYAATAIAPKRSGESRLAMKIAVGPSAPPKSPMAAALVERSLWLCFGEDFGNHDVVSALTSCSLTKWLFWDLL